jgi:LmbE family N-acetylglucosaminyl deacetylase
VNLLPWFQRKNGNTPADPFGGRRGALPPLEDGKPKTLMAIMAHPDDIDFGSAGSIAKWCSEGWTVYYVLATSGDKGTHEGYSRQELAALREEEQRAAARVLGVKEVFFLGYPDGFLPASTELRGEIVRLFRIYKPDVVMTWDGFRAGFNHSDHRNIGIAVRDAMYPAVRDHLYYPEHAEEGLGAVRVNELLLTGSDQPDYFVDVSAFIETKADAMLCHASQISTHDRDELIKNLRGRGRRGRGNVESFKRVRIGRPSPPPAETPAGSEGSAANPGLAGASTSSS